jgi:hypothetical protein
MCGRGSRAAPGKTHFKIIDMFSNFVQHGQWDTPRDWVSIFEHPPQPGRAPTKQCPRCNNVIPVSTRVCYTPVENYDGSIGICGYTWDIQECFPKERVESKSFEEVPKELFTPKKPVGAMSMKELIAFADNKGYHKMWAFHRARMRGYDAVQEFAEAKGYKPGWIRYQIQRRKEALWKDIKKKYGSRADHVGAEVKKIIEQRDGDFFRAEEDARRQLL